MTELLFIAQKKLEAWIEEGKVTFQGTLLTLLAEQAAYELEPAVRVLRLLDGQDRAGLMGKIWSIAQLTKRGAEHMGNSVILGDTAYECEEGFVGVQAVKPPAPKAAPPVRHYAPPPAAPAKPAPASSVASAVANATGGAKSSTNDADLLSEFLLKHL